MKIKIRGKNKMTDQLVVREATLEDRKPIWEWWNDPITRKMMKKNDHVPWEEHCAWFEKVLEDENRILCVGLVDQHKIGVVRFDLRIDEIYEVSINLNPFFRGKGYGSKVLLKSMEYLTKDRKVKKLFAMCKKINIASRKTFEKAGFTVVDPKQYYPGMERFDGEAELYCELNF
jgi:RimJ/RimL family protein N-acetyltransferase